MYMLNFAKGNQNRFWLLGILYQPITHFNTIVVKNSQFEFFLKEKVSRTRFMFKKILFSIQFFNLWLKKPLEMTNLSSKCTTDSISLK